MHENYANCGWNGYSAVFGGWKITLLSEPQC